jgi:hypothetical protein
MEAEMDADVVAGIAALLGIKLPAERAAAIAREQSRVAERVARARVQPEIDDEPTDFARAQR